MINNPTIQYQSEDNKKIRTFLAVLFCSVGSGIFFFFYCKMVLRWTMSINLTNSIDFYLNKTLMHMLQGIFISLPVRRNHSMGIIQTRSSNGKHFDERYMRTYEGENTAE